MNSNQRKKIIIAAVIAVIIILAGIGVRLIYSRYEKALPENDSSMLISTDDNTEDTDDNTENTDGIIEDPDDNTEDADIIAENNAAEDIPAIPEFDPDSVTWTEATDLDIDTLMEYPEILTSVCTVIDGSDYHYYISEDMADQKFSFTYKTDINVTGYAHTQPMSIDQEWTDSGEFVIDRYGAPANITGYYIQDISVKWYMYDGTNTDKLIAEWTNNGRICTIILNGDDLSDVDIKELIEQSLSG